MPNPYFDDSDDEQTPAQGVPAVPNSDAPETSGAVELPEWARITSDFIEGEEEKKYSATQTFATPAPAQPEGFMPVPVETPAPPVSNAPISRPKIARPASPAVEESTPVPARPVSLPPPSTPAPPVVEEKEPVQQELPKLLPRESSERTVPAPSGRFDDDDEYDMPRSQIRNGRRSTASGDTEQYHEEEEEEDLLARRMREIEEEEEEYTGRRKRSSKSSTRDSKNKDKRKRSSRLSRQKTQKPSTRSRGHEENTEEDDFEESTRSSQGAWAGGRRKVLILRIIIFSVLGVVFALGLKQIIAPTNVNVEQVTEQVAATIGGSDFPVAAGQSLAEFFVEEYLTLDPSDRAGRDQRLEAIVLPDDDSLLTLNGVERQVITSGPFLAEDPLVGSQSAVYTFAVQIQTTLIGDASPGVPSWLYLSVPVMKTTGKTLLIGGMPGLVPAPVVVPPDTTAFVNGVDGSASSSFGQEAKLFFEAWAASDQTALSRYINADSTETARAGLNGLVTLSSILKTEVEAFPVVEEGVELSPYRQALVTLTWEKNGLELVQQYRMLVGQGNDGRWYVQDIIGGGFQ